MFKPIIYSDMKHNLKYLAPAAAVTTLFLVGCGDDDTVAAADYPCEGTTGNEALLGGSWQLTKENDVTVIGSEFTDEDGAKYTYSLVYAFECGGDFDIKQVLIYTDDPNPLVYEYEGSWDFTSADGTIGIDWTNDLKEEYEWDFEIESVSQTALKGKLYAEGDTTLQEFKKI